MISFVGSMTSNISSKPILTSPSVLVTKFKIIVFEIIGNVPEFIIGFIAKRKRSLKSLMIVFKMIGPKLPELIFISI